MKTIIWSALLTAAIVFGSLANAQCPDDIGCFTSIKLTAQTGKQTYHRERTPLSVDI